MDKAADPEMARSIVLNSKMRRTGVCGAAETLLIDRAAAPTLLEPLVRVLIDAGCEVRGDRDTQALAADHQVKLATEEDWSTEYLDAIIAVKLVDGVEGAIAHVERYGSHHTDAIVTADCVAAEKFLGQVDSAIVLHNASTQFADGGEFGFGAEIGIATGRLHARGPVGVEQLTTFKYRVRGAGQDASMTTAAGAVSMQSRAPGIARSSRAAEPSALPHSASSFRPAHRAVRWNLRSAARGAPCCLPAGNETARSRSRVVASDAGQSPQGHDGTGPP